MSQNMADAVRQLAQEKGIDEDLVLKMIEETLKAAYKRKFGTSENAVVTFNEDHTAVSIYSKKIIVDGVYNPVLEIEIEEALDLAPDCEVGDELLIEVDPKEFDRISVQSAKQTAHQSIKDIQKDNHYAEFKDKVGEIIIGYFQRERNGNIFVDLGKVEGIFPKKFQSPREVYRQNDRIKALITEVKKTSSGLQIVLSRTDPEFVKKILELEVPEIYDKTVEIYKIVREPGYRTKVAVYSHREDVDPVGSCVGLKGVRIQAVIRELEGEKIDVLKYDPNPIEFIKNSLSPAEVLDVVILDAQKKSAIAIVPDEQFSLAIGKQGLNVRLANRLADWNIDVKTEDQFDELDLSAESRKAVEELFDDSQEFLDFTDLFEIEGISEELVELLVDNDVLSIEDLLSVNESEINEFENFSEEQINFLIQVRHQYEESDEEQQGVDLTDEIDDEYEHEEYECPECGGVITIDMTTCPSCGIGLSFEYEDEE